jgi:hypothetical protein
MLRAEELYFSIHRANLLNEGNDDWNVITFCPIEYWIENECLPDYFIGGLIMIDPPTGYTKERFTEEYMWSSKKSREEIVKDLTSLGFVYSKELEDFLTDCRS